MKDPMDTLWQDGHPSAPQLDGYGLGEFDGAVEQQLAAHVAACPACARRLEAMLNFSAPAAEARILATVQEELLRRQARRRSAFGISAALAAVIALALLVGPQVLDLTGDSTPDTTPRPLPSAVRLKGAPVNLLLYQLRPDGPHLLQPSLSLELGARLQAAVTVAAPGHVALYDVMSDHVALLAANPQSTVQGVRPGSEWPLEPAFELVSVEEGERLVLLFCPQKFAPTDAPTTPAAFATWMPVSGCLRANRLFRPETGEAVR